MTEGVLFETALVAFTTFFATIMPFDIAALFAALTPRNTGRERRRMALKGTVIAAVILLFFVLLGDKVFGVFGITMPALRTAGGILLLLIAIDMVFARHSGGTTTTSDENAEARASDDISVFPLATPLIAGPGTIGAATLMSTKAEGDALQIGAVIAALFAVLVLTLISMLMATQLQRLLGVTGLQVISRVIGVILSALAVQFIFDGIARSGLLA